MSFSFTFSLVFFFYFIAFITELADLKDLRVIYIFIIILDINMYMLTNIYSFGTVIYRENLI